MMKYMRPERPSQPRFQCPELQQDDERWVLVFDETVVPAGSLGAVNLWAYKYMDA